MPVTIKDVARKAQVSHSTVSRALRGSSLVSSQTADRIRQTASDLGYSPSAIARSLKTNRSMALGVIIRDVDDPFFGEILQGIEEVARSHGYSLFMAASPRGQKHDGAIVQAMVERRVDGVIICSTQVSNEESRQFTSFGVPIVMVNNQSAEEYRYSIYHDDVDGSRQITRHLINLGHRNIAYLGNSRAGRSTLDRLSGVRDELRLAGMPLPDLFFHEEPGGSPADGLAGIRHFLALPKPPQAVVCYNDMMAMGVVRGLHDAHLRVPEDVSVTGFDNIVFSAYTHPPLTTIDQPKRTIGAQAAELVLGLLNLPEGVEAPGPKIHRLKGRLLIRNSTAGPRG